MGKLICNQENVNESNIEELLKVCPFGAIEYTDGKVQVNAGCKMCKICVKKGPAGVMEFVETETKKVDKSLWKGIAVYVDHVEGTIHPVTMEPDRKSQRALLPLLISQCIAFLSATI